MTDMTESTEYLAFKRQKDGYKVKKFPCVFIYFYPETNSKSGKIYLLATIKYTRSAYLPPPNLYETSHFWISLWEFSLQNETLILDDLLYLYNVNAVRHSYLFESSLRGGEA